MGATVSHQDVQPATRSLYALSQGFFVEETKWTDRIEGVVLSVVIALAAWPIIGSAYTFFAV